MATCPECEYDEIDTEDFEEGDEMSCPECGKRLVYSGNDAVDFADEDDDLDDDDEDEDEDDDDLGDDEDGDDDDLDEDDDRDLDDE